VSDNTTSRSGPVYTYKWRRHSIISIRVLSWYPCFVFSWPLFSIACSGCKRHRRRPIRSWSSIHHD